MGLFFLFAMVPGFVLGVIVALLALMGSRRDQKTIAIWKCLLMCVTCVILAGFFVINGGKMLAFMIHGPEEYMISTDEIDFSAYQSQNSAKLTGGILPMTVMKVRNQGPWYWITIEVRLQEKVINSLPVSYCGDDPSICGRTQGP